MKRFEQIDRYNANLLIKGEPSTEVNTDLQASENQAYHGKMLCSLKLPSKVLSFNLHVLQTAF